jgi:hypothetical protein
MRICYLAVRNCEVNAVYLTTLYQLPMLLLGYERKVTLCELVAIEDEAVVPFSVYFNRVGQ